MTKETPEIKRLERNVGRTFRTLLRAIERASKGENVLFLCPNSRMIDYSIKMAFDICRVVSDVTKLKMCDKTLEIGEGCVRFYTCCSSSERIRGLQFHSSFIDHAVYSVNKWSELDRWLEVMEHVKVLNKTPEKDDGATL